MRLLRMLSAGLALPGSVLAMPANAWSGRATGPLRRFVPYPPGGIAHLPSRRLGHQVRVEHREGGGDSTTRSPSRGWRAWRT